MSYPRHRETSDRVPGIAPALRTRFRRRAERRCLVENARRGVPFYRWEVVEEDGRFVVAAFQNVAVPE